MRKYKLRKILKDGVFGTLWLASERNWTPTKLSQKGKSKVQLQAQLDQGAQNKFKRLWHLCFWVLNPSVCQENHAILKFWLNIQKKRECFSARIHIVNLKEGYDWPFLDQVSSQAQLLWPAKIESSDCTALVIFLSLWGEVVCHDWRPLQGYLQWWQNGFSKKSVVLRGEKKI